MRLKYSRYGIEARISLALATLSILILGVAALWIPVRKKNAAAKQGTCGLLVGAFFGVLFFSPTRNDEFSELTSMLLSPLAGALMGLAVSYIRWRLADCPGAEDETAGMTWGEHPIATALPAIKHAAP